MEGLRIFVATFRPIHFLVFLQNLSVDVFYPFTAPLPPLRPTTALKDLQLSLLPIVATFFPKPPRLPDLLLSLLPPTPSVITTLLVCWEDPMLWMSTTLMFVST
jgi:hypothetical protein